MSFFSDLFHGNFGNLGEDIAPQNIFKDTVSSFQNQPEWAKIAEFALPAIALGGVGLGALGAGGAAAEGGLAAADIGAGAADWTAAGLDVGGTLGPGTAAATGAVDIGTPVLSDAAISGLEASPGAGAMASLTDPAFATGTSAVPYADIAGGLTGGGGADVPGIMPFSPTTEIATGGDVIPNVATAGGAGFVPGGGAATDLSNVSLDAMTYGAQGGPPLAVAPGGAAAPAAAGTGAPTSLLGAMGADLKAAAPWLGAAGLGYNLFQGYQQNQALKAEQAAVKQQADAVAQAGRASLAAAQPDLAIGQALMTGGPVPGPMQAMLDNLRNGERARIIQGYAARDPTNPAAADPKMNSALAQDLNNLDTNLAAFREQLGQQIVTTANQLLSSGASAAQIAENMMVMMNNLDLRLQQVTGNAIANFAAAMSGGTMRVAGSGTGQNINLNLGGASSALSPFSTGQ